MPPKPKDPVAAISSITVSDLTVTINTSGTRAAPSSNLTDWKVNWGDNFWEGHSGNPQKILKHTYGDYDQYSAIFTIYDSNGKSDSVPFIIKAVPPIPPPPQPGAVLNPTTDLSYDGCFGVQLSGYTATNIFNAWAALSGRVVSGQTRIFTLGNHPSQMGYLVEYVVPSILASNPSQLGNNSNFRATISRDWGNIYNEDPTVGDVKRENGPGNLVDVDGQILFINGKIYWSFWASYNVAGTNNRCFGLSELDDTTGLATRRGPWRTAIQGGNVGAKFNNANLAEIPSSFANTYLSGKKIHIGGQAGASGAASSPAGMTWYAMDDISAPYPPASSISNALDIAFTPQKLIAYDLNSRQPITIENWRRRTCFYQDPGNHAVTTAPVNPGDTIIPISDCTLYAVDQGSLDTGFTTTWYGYVGVESNGLPFGYNNKSVASGPGNLTGVPASGFHSISAFIPTGTIISLGKYDNGRGGIQQDPFNYFGPDSLSSDPGALWWDYIGMGAWINSPSGKQGVLFLGSVADSVTGGAYGTDDRTHVRYTGQATCPHGQLSPYFQGTGPTANDSIQVGWIYDQNDFALIAQGALGQASLVPKYYFRFNSIAPGIAVEAQFAGGLTQAWYDIINSKLYIIEKNADRTFAPSDPLHVIHRFSVL